MKIRIVDEPEALGFGEKGYIQRKQGLVRMRRDREGRIRKGWE